MTHKLGAHQSVAGGYHNALTSIHEKGGNCLQIFSSSPRSWQDASPSDEIIEHFNDLRKKLTISPIYFHARYLINLADPGPSGPMSVKTIIRELDLASRMGVRGSVVHTGTFRNKNEIEVFRNNANYALMIENIKQILDETLEETVMILENAGTRKIGQSIEHLANILEDVQNDRLKVCLDTCHLHAAGYDLKTPDNFDKFLDNFDKLIGLKCLELVHMNDSKDPFGSLRDRHENIGKGFVGEEVFKNFINNPRTENLPFILEVPGLDDKGPDKANLDIVKSYIISS